MINLNKQYETRDGREVRNLIKLKNPDSRGFQICGQVLNPPEKGCEDDPHWNVHVWKYNGLSENLWKMYDLIEITSSTRYYYIFKWIGKCEYEVSRFFKTKKERSESIHTMKNSYRLFKLVAKRRIDMNKKDPRYPNRTEL